VEGHQRVQESMERYGRLLRLGSWSCIYGRGQEHEECRKTRRMVKIQSKKIYSMMR
jgi:hypothetical protein